ncbi:MAG: DUF5684 domain-containing protein [Nannocystaceae bacterium]|nr:DUF5684 domain-containing protein [bacterium]
MEYAFLVVYLAVMIVAIAGVWKTFEKAGQPGWACLVPIYQFYVMIQIAGKPTWWLILCFVPFVNFVMIFLIPIAIAEKFGKGAGFGVGLALLGFIFYPMLGFGDATYNRNA